MKSLDIKSKLTYPLAGLVIVLICMTSVWKQDYKNQIAVMQAYNDSLELELQKAFPSQIELNRYMTALEILWSKDSAAARKYYETLTNDTE